MIHCRIALVSHHGISLPQKQLAYVAISMYYRYVFLSKYRNLALTHFHTQNYNSVLLYLLCGFLFARTTYRYFSLLGLFNIYLLLVSWIWDGIWIKSLKSHVKLDIVKLKLSSFQQNLKIIVDYQTTLFSRLKLCCQIFTLQKLYALFDLWADWISKSWRGLSKR